MTNIQKQLLKIWCCIKELQGNNPGGADTDWVQVANAVVYNITENIGIGTALPDRKLCVVGDAGFSYQDNSDNATYQLQWGDIDIDSIAPGFNSEGFRIDVTNGTTGNGVEEIMIADDAFLGVGGYWRKNIKATDLGSGIQNEFEIIAEADGLTLTATTPSTGNASQVRLTPDGSISISSLTNGGSDNLTVNFDGNGVNITLQPGTGHRFKIENLPVYPDNTSAKVPVGILNVGEWYQTPTGEPRIVV
jgi:hypothetical protein